MIKLYINKKDEDGNPYSKEFELDTTFNFGDTFKVIGEGIIFTSCSITNIISEDKIVESVRQDLLERSQRGINKYGTTLDRDDLQLRDWLQHAYEECLDQANYLKKSIVELNKNIILKKQVAAEAFSKTGLSVEEIINNIGDNTKVDYSVLPFDRD